MDKLRIMRLLTEYARPEILKEFRVDSCIASTRIGMDVLDHFGVFSEPLPVQVMIWNPAYVARAQTGDRHPQNDEELDVWVKESGAWVIGLGYGPKNPNKWPGHLALLAEKRYLIDLSLDQANRPQYNINLDVLGAEVDDDFISGKKPYVLNMSGSMVKYVVVPSNTKYTTSPNWMFRSQRANIVASIIAKINKEIS